MKPFDEAYPQVREYTDYIHVKDASGTEMDANGHNKVLPAGEGDGQVRELVADGAIGEVRMAVNYLTQRRPAPAELADGQVPWRVNPALSGGGFFFEAVCRRMSTHPMVRTAYIVSATRSPI